MRSSPTSRTGRRGRPDRARHRARRPHRLDAADEPRFLRGVLRGTLCGRNAGSDLSAGAPVRRSRSILRRQAGHPAQCRRPSPDHGARGARGWRVAAWPGRNHGGGRERPRSRGSGGGRSRLPPIADGTRSRSSNTRRAAPATRRAWCSATPICSPISARIGAAPWRQRSADVFVSWLPLYHDFGLIGAWLGCLYFAASFYVMSPLSFLVRPESWLRADPSISRHAVGCAEFRLRALPRTRSQDADLDGPRSRLAAHGRQWRRAGERADVAPLHRALRTIRLQAGGHGAGLRTCGELRVGLAFPPPGPPAGHRPRRSRRARAARGVAEPARADDARPRSRSSPAASRLPGHEVRIVDDLGREVGERHEGRLEFRGPSATPGYFRNEAKTRELFHDGWLDSGDPAYMADGEVYITGRIKDIIIRAGRNIYPQEDRGGGRRHSGRPQGRRRGIRRRRTKSGTERIVVMAETARDAPASREALRADRAGDATDILGAPPDEVVLVPPRHRAEDVERQDPARRRAGSSTRAAAAARQRHALVAADAASVACRHRAAVPARRDGFSARCALCGLVVDGGRRSASARLARRHDAAAAVAGAGPASRASRARRSRSRRSGCGRRRRRACRGATRSWCSITRATWMRWSWPPCCRASRSSSPSRSSHARLSPARSCGDWMSHFVERFDVAGEPGRRRRP